MKLRELCLLVGVLVGPASAIRTHTLLSDNTLVIGTEGKSVDGHPFAHFRGIRYAKAPLGDMRFKPTETFRHDHKVIVAKNNGLHCVQNSFIVPLMDPFSGEDCLFLNIASRDLGGKLPVIAYIHGGAFLSGTCDDIVYPPARLMNHNIVVVTIQYRLGVFGFLATGDGASHGNYGLMDQNLALQWVHDNIDRFGGDPDRITIMGESAGGASVSYQTVAPKSKGLFQQSIQQSGSVFSFWAFEKQPLQHTQALAEGVKCPTTDTFAMVDCLRKAKLQDILNVDWKMRDNGFFLNMKFVPTIDGDFFKEDPREILKRGEINPDRMMFGVNSEEGLVVHLLKAVEMTPFFLTESLFKKYALKMFDAFTKFSDNEGPFAMAWDRYQKGLNYVLQTRPFQLRNAKMYSDMLFAAGVRNCIKWVTKNGKPAWAYQFDSRSANVMYPAPAPERVGLLNIYKDGVMHAFDLCYTWNCPLSKPWSPPDLATALALVRAEATFAIEGNPGWPQVKANDPIVDYMHIHDAFPKMRKGNYSAEDTFEFWMEEIHHP